MGNDQCCGPRQKKDVRFEKQDSDQIFRVFTLIANSHSATKNSNTIHVEAFTDYLFETTSIQTILVSHFFANQLLLSYDRFAACCCDLLFSPTSSSSSFVKLPYFERLIQRKYTISSDARKSECSISFSSLLSIAGAMATTHDNAWRKQLVSKEELNNLLSEIFGMIELIDSVKYVQCVPSPSLIVSSLFMDSLLKDESKPWEEVFEFLSKDFPLFDSVIKNYYEYKFLLKPMTFGLPELPLKSSVTMDEDICSAIALTNARMLTKKTIVERLFSSGELGFDFKQFRSAIEKNIGDVLVLMKFLGKDEQAGTSFMHVIGYLIPDGFLLNQELILDKSRSLSNTNTAQCTLFEVSPRFRPLYAKKKITTESIKQSAGSTQQTLQQQEVEHVSEVRISDAGLAVGYNSENGNPRIWIDRDMLNKSTFQPSDDYFHDGFEPIPESILVNVEAWGVNKRNSRYSQHTLCLADYNFQQYLQCKNYQQIFHTDSDSMPRGSHAYCFQNNSITNSESAFFRGLSGEADQVQINDENGEKIKEQLVNQSTVKKYGSLQLERSNILGDNNQTDEMKLTTQTKVKNYMNRQTLNPMEMRKKYEYVAEKLRKQNDERRTAAIVHGISSELNEN